MRVFKRILQDGDTIVEVMLALSTLSLILFISWGVTNRATQISLNARKRIEMVNQIKEQAEIIKSLHATNGTDSTIFQEKVVGTQLPEDVANLNPCEEPRTSEGVPRNASYLSVTNAETVSSPGVKVVDDTSSVWIQYSQGAGYIDFYVRGCWLSTGGTQKEENSQFVVRLNT